VKNYIIRRCFSALFVMFGVATIVFFLVRLTGDPVRLMMSADANEEQVESMRVYLGYDRPLGEQYLRFLGQLFRLNFGNSLRYNMPTLQLILERMTLTIKLSFLGILFAVVIALPLGIFAAIRRGTAIDQGLMTVSLIGQALPAFWVGILLVLLFSIVLRWLPTGGTGGWKHYILPCVVLAMRPCALFSRLLRSSLTDAFEADYVRTAKAKGIPSSWVICRHALRNSLLPVITVVGLEFGSMLGGAIVVETLFALPGLGQLLNFAIQNRDFPLVQAILIFIAFTFVFINLLVDVLYAYLDPRIRYD